MKEGILMLNQTKKSANRKVQRFITIMLAVALMLAGTACSTDTGRNNTSTSNSSATSPGAIESNAPEESGNDTTAQEIDNLTGPSEPVEADVNNVNMKEVTQAYREILIENESHIKVGRICIVDICGDSIPELLYITTFDTDDNRKEELHIWTYNGSAIEILADTVVDWSQEYGPYSCGEIFVTNDGGLYTYCSASRSGSNHWSYEIHFCYNYSDESQMYLAHAITSSSVIKYIYGFDIFDGYSTEGWDDLEKFDKAKEALMSNVAVYLFSDNYENMQGVPKPEQMQYDEAMEYLGRWQ